MAEIPDLGIRRTLASNVREIAAQQGLTNPTAIARRCGVSQDQVRGICLANRSAGVDKLAVIARGLRVPVYVLLMPPGEARRVLEAYEQASPRVKAALVQLAEAFVGDQDDPPPEANAHNERVSDTTPPQP